jgi:hypothetical protein
MQPGILRNVSLPPAVVSPTGAEFLQAHPFHRVRVFCLEGAPAAEGVRISHILYCRGPLTSEQARIAWRQPINLTDR